MVGFNGGVAQLDPKPIVHGKYKGWQQCRKRPEGACLDCREAARQYQANRRKTNAAAYKRDKLKLKARDHAMREVARRHHKEYRKLAVEYEAALAAGWNPSSS
jgi:hypothetical protein